MAKEISFHVSSGTLLPSGDVWFQLEPLPYVPSLPFSVEVRVRKAAPTGRLICTGMRLGDPEDGGEQAITGAALRELPMKRILSVIGEELEVRTAVGEWAAQPIGRDLAGDERAAAERERDWMAAYAACTPPIPEDPTGAARRGRPPLRSAEFYQRLAHVYRQSLGVNPHHPYSEVVKHATEDDGPPVWEPTTDHKYQASHEAAARKLIWYARKRGFVAPTARGKAGEDTSSERRGTP